MRNYKNYDVWQKSHQFVLFLYREIVPGYPKSQQFELASQIRRAAYSVSLNIVEGCGRRTDDDFAHFLDIALGSVHETEYCGLLSFELGFISEENFRIFTVKLDEVKAKLINLIKSIRIDK